MINHAIAVGRLTKDPELRKTTGGKSVINFTVACSSGFGKKQTTDFINVQAWDTVAEFMDKYLKKGALVGCVGKTISNNYKKDDGTWVNNQLLNASQVVSMENKNTQNQDQESYTAPSFSQPASVPSQQDFEDDAPTLDISNDDLPF